MIKHSCKHFTSPIHNDSCRAGVNYVNLAGGTRFGYLVRIPCSNSSALSEDVVTCDKKEDYTLDEINKKEEAFELRANHMVTAIEIIQKKVGKSRGCSGSIDCPECGKDLKYSVASGNGHIWAKCSTPGCIVWIT